MTLPMLSRRRRSDHSNFNLGMVVNWTRQDFVDRYSGSVLGLAWVLIWPLVQVTIFTLIFSQIMGARLPGNSDTYAYSVYLVAGVVPWTAFANTVSRVTTVFLDKKHILSKVRVSMPLLASYIVLSEAVTFAVTMAVFLMYLVAFGHDLGTGLLFVPLIFVLQQVFAFALGLICACLIVFIRDVKEIVGIVLQLWFWFTPIVYVADIVPESIRGWLELNPSMLFIESYHAIFVHGGLPVLDDMVTLAVTGGVLLAVSLLMLRKLERDIRDFL
nr:ABC transporter permease [Skermanella mucosa]